MSQLTWKDLKDSGITWEELANSGLTWNDLKRDTLDLFIYINQNKLNLPECFIKKLDNLVIKSVNIYNQFSNTPISNENNSSPKDKLLLICKILVALGTFLSGAASAADTIQNLSKKRESIIIEIHNLNNENSNSHTKETTIIDK